MDSGSQSKADILIVDDAPTNLRLLSNMLAEHGYRVRPVPEGELAIAAAQVEPPDLVLLDIMMPEMNGFEVCRRLKADSRTNDIPIIFISALDEIHDKVEAFRLGGLDYITKPFHFEEVLARVETHLSLRKLQQQLLDVNKKMSDEVTLAGEVQANFLPRSLPIVQGWGFSAQMKAAGTIAGDFYDIFHLPDGRLGILVADVVDHGVGAALFMVLCWSLIRTYAASHPSEPARVMSEVNRRILAEAGSQELVTAFYGALSPESGELIYCSAAHRLAFWIGASGAEISQLQRDDLPLGTTNVTVRKQNTFHLKPGSALALFSDGITQASSADGKRFGQEALIASIKANYSANMHELKAKIMADVSLFMGEAPQRDDITITIIQRDNTKD